MSVCHQIFQGKETLKTLPTEQKWCIYFKYRVEEGMEPLMEELYHEEEGIMRADRALKKLIWIKSKASRPNHDVFYNNYCHETF